MGGNLVHYCEVSEYQHLQITSHFLQHAIPKTLVRRSNPKTFSSHVLVEIILPFLRAVNSYSVYEASFLRM